MRSEPKSPEQALIINSDWRIICDTDNYILQKRRVVRKEGSKNLGMESWDDWAYHSRLQDVFSTTAEQFIRDNWFDVDAILKSLDELRQKISVLTSYKGV